MGKTLCDWSKKEIEKNFDLLCEIVATSDYVCRKCARSAMHSKYLCKAKKVRRKGGPSSHR